MSAKIGIFLQCRKLSLGETWQHYDIITFFIYETLQFYAIISFFAYLCKRNAILLPYFKDMMEKKTIKDRLKQAFLFYALSAMTAAVMFVCFMQSSSVKEVMDLEGWVFFAASCLSHASQVLSAPVVMLRHHRQRTPESSV